MTSDEAMSLVSAAKVDGVGARVEFHEYAPKREDGSYTGEVLRRYSVALKIADVKTGNAVVETIQTPIDDAALRTLIIGMRTALRGQAKATRAAIRAERECE